MMTRSASFALLILLAVAAAGGQEAAERPSIQGVVTGPDGEALEGVRVDVSTAAPKVGRGMFCPSCYLDCAKWATTDDRGRFTIERVSPSLKFRLVLTRPGHRTLQTKLIDPSEGPVSLTLDALPTDIDPAHVVAGVVTQSTVPVAGALIEPHGAKTASRRWWGRVDGVDPAVTDQHGRFSMTLPDELVAVDIEVTGHGFCGEQLELVEPGGEPLQIDVRGGANVVGRLVHAGKPVAGMSIAVVQLNRSVNDGIFIAAVGDVTDEEGKFQFRHLPPDQRYCIYSMAGEAKQSDNSYILTTKTFTVPATGETRDLGSLEVASPCTISGKLLPIDRQPLPKNLKISLGRDPAWDLIGVPVQDDGSFEATGLPPETYEIRIGSPKLEIVADEVRYQMLSDASFGVRLRHSIDDLVIPVRHKE